MPKVYGCRIGNKNYHATCYSTLIFLQIPQGQHRLFHPCNRYSQSSSSLDWQFVEPRRGSGTAAKCVFPSLHHLPVLGFRWLFQTEGPVNALLSSIGISPILAGQHYLGNASVDFVEHLETAGFNMVFLAGLQAIPTSRYEAAELEPMPGSSFGIFYLDYVPPSSCNDHDCHFTLRSFEQVYVITGGGPLNSTNLLVYYIYEQAFAQFDFGYAAAAATVLLAIALLLVYLQLRTWGEEVS